MKVALLFSGGKDSVFAAFCLMQQGYEVRLLTLVPAEYSAMFHHPNVKWCGKQAEAMGLPIKVVKAEGRLGGKGRGNAGGRIGKAEGDGSAVPTEKEELWAMKDALRKMNVDAVAAGAIESEYQKERVDRIAHELGIISFSPIWRTGEALLEGQCKYLETYVVAVSAEGLGRDDLGKKFDAGFVARLKRMKPQVSEHLEGGEGETFTAGAPFFSRTLRIMETEKKWDGTRGVEEIISLA